MATRAASLSKPDREGQYARQLGWKVNGRGKRVQHKFRLGSDKSAAAVREALLRRVWDIVERHAGAQDSEPNKGVRAEQRCQSRTKGAEQRCQESLIGKLRT
jgi:hypothetical protein